MPDSCVTERIENVLHAALDYIAEKGPVHVAAGFTRCEVACYTHRIDAAIEDPLRSVSSRHPTFCVVG